MIRCPWAKTELCVQYHDTEWGVPVHDDRLLFEFLILEGAQAGLNWETILKKRENYRRAFDNFDPALVARYGQKKRKSLLSDSGIVRNRLKIEAAIQNAKAFLTVQDEIGEFDEYIWGFVGQEPMQNTWSSIKEVPPKTPESDALSKDLKRRGFKFVGSTICYAFMQAVGMVNDHVVDCFRHGEGGPGHPMKDEASYTCDSCLKSGNARSPPSESKSSRAFRSPVSTASSSVTPSAIGSNSFNGGEP
jgi:DNA-3-methyladenine glycosylase I